MRTPPPFIRRVIFTIAVLAGSSAIVPATGHAAEPTDAPPAAPGAAPEAPPAPPPADTMKAAPASAPSAGPTQVVGAGTASAAVATPEPAEPASITEVGVQRLPGSAYPEPQIRGLKHGSLWLTFHGLQWPYMPSFTSDKRFVVGVSGWGWIDNSYQKFVPWGDNPNIENDKIKYWKQQARMLLRLTPTYAIDRDSFIQGQVELVGTGDQSISRFDVGGADTDDLYIRAGQWNKWDVQFGRFEGWEVFHLGMGLDFNTFERQGAVGPGESDNKISFYGLTDNQFRPLGAAGNFAFHYYPLPILRFELLGMAGSTSGPAYAARPVGILDLGWFKLKLGTEYQHVGAQQVSDQTDITSKGVGGAVQFVFAPHIEFGLNAAQGTVWAIDRIGQVSPEGSFTRTTFGGFANISNGHPTHTLIFGVGSMITYTEDQNGITPNPQDKYWLYQGFLAAQYVIHNVFYIKLVGGYSRGHWSIAGNDPRIEFDNEVYSARLRFSFYF
jgi:hypothetical protein